MAQVGAWFPEGMMNLGDPAKVQASESRVRVVAQGSASARSFERVLSQYWSTVTSQTKLTAETLETLQRKELLSMQQRSNRSLGGNLVLCSCGMQCGELSH